MIDSMAMLDALQELGFTPHEDGSTFDLAFGDAYADRMVRVGFDDNQVTIYVLTGNEVGLWDVRLREAPYALFKLTLDAAVSEASANRPRSWRHQ